MLLPLACLDVEGQVKAVVAFPPFKGYGNPVDGEVFAGYGGRAGDPNGDCLPRPWLPRGLPVSAPALLVHNRNAGKGAVPYWTDVQYPRLCPRGSSGRREMEGAALRQERAPVDGICFRLEGEGYFPVACLESFRDNRFSLQERHLEDLRRPQRGQALNRCQDMPLKTK